MCRSFYDFRIPAQSTGNSFISSFSICLKLHVVGCQKSAVLRASLALKMACLFLFIGLLHINKHFHVQHFCIDYGREE